jgi:hypothetical protein
MVVLPTPCRFVFGIVLGCHRWCGCCPCRRVSRSGRGIMLLAADGESNTEIAVRVGVSRPTVVGWRDRYRRER